jgi:hypothetical protein
MRKHFDVAEYEVQELNHEISAVKPILKHFGPVENTELVLSYISSQKYTTGRLKLREVII